MTRHTLNLDLEHPENNPQYEDDPAQVALSMPIANNVLDYLNANPGQWFYGVVNTLTGDIYLVAGDVHDDPNNATQLNARMRNTYASKPEIPMLNPDGPRNMRQPLGWQSLTGHERFNGIESDPTGHQAVCALYALNSGECLGFRIIRTNDTIAQFSDRSNSLNGNKPDQRAVVVIDAGPAVPIAGATQVVRGPGGWGASPSARMPPQWADAVTDFLTRRLGIMNWAKDF